MDTVFKPPQEMDSGYFGERTTVCTEIMATQLAVAHPVFSPDSINASKTSVAEYSKPPIILNARRLGLAIVKNTTNCGMQSMLHDYDFFGITNFFLSI